jgi:hypothetical protein
MGFYHRRIADYIVFATLIACALRPDLALLPQGDMTEVGEKGVLKLRLSQELMS